MHGKPGRLFSHRKDVLDLLLEAGRPLKLNYVYTGQSCVDDLAALLDWAAGRPLVVNLLDDLGELSFSSAIILQVLLGLRGPWQKVELVPDVNSLSTHHLLWADGLRVEVKTQQLGRFAPWRHCQGCFLKSRCREGIYALRLSHDGVLRLCMDRHDLKLPVSTLALQSDELALHAWQQFVASSMAIALDEGPEAPETCASLSGKGVPDDDRFSRLCGSAW